MRRRIKRWFATILSATLILSMLSVPAMAAEPVAGFDWQVDGSTLTLTGSGELDLNSVSKTSSLPWNEEEIDTVIIKGATSLGERCFYKCTNLKSITLPDELESIGQAAFQGCSSLVLTQLPSNLKSIGPSAFSECTSLALTSLPEGITTIEDYAFEECNNLVLTDLSGVTSIGKAAFYDCWSMNLTQLPSSLKSIGQEAFAGCIKLSFTEIPEGVTDIGTNAFSNCYGLTGELTLPESLETLGDEVFNGCSGLKTLRFKGMTAPKINGQLLSGLYNGSIEGIYAPKGATGYDAAHGWPEDKIKILHDVKVVNPAEGGTATADSTEPYSGDTVTLTATPSDDYHLKEWQTEPKVEITENKFTMPNANVTVTPVFELHDFTTGEWQSDSTNHWKECTCGKEGTKYTHTYVNGACSTCGYGGHNVTVNVNTSEWGEAKADITYAGNGITITLTATPSEGYHLKEWQTEPKVEVKDDNTFSMPDQDITITAVFEAHDFSGNWKQEKTTYTCMSYLQSRGKSEPTYIQKRNMYCLYI